MAIKVRDAIKKLLDMPMDAELMIQFEMRNVNEEQLRENPDRAVKALNGEWELDAITKGVDGDVLLKSYADYDDLFEDDAGDSTDE